MDEQTYQSCGSFIKKIECKKSDKLMEPMYVSRERGGNVLSYVNFSKICYVMKYFP